MCPSSSSGICRPGLPQSFKDYGLGEIEADVVHSNTFCVPRFRDKKKKLIVTVYDLTVLTHPECHRKANIRHCLDGIKDAIKYADAIVAISESTRADLVNYLDAPPGLITVTHLAAAGDLRPVEDIEVPRRRGSNILSRKGTSSSSGPTSPGRT